MVTWTIWYTPIYLVPIIAWNLLENIERKWFFYPQKVIGYTHLNKDKNRDKLELKYLRYRMNQEFNFYVFTLDKILSKSIRLCLIMVMATDMAKLCNNKGSLGFKNVS